MDYAFQYIKDNGGIDTEKSYPYEAEDDKCRYNPVYRGATDIGFVDVPAGDEEALKSAIATQGPCSLPLTRATRASSSTTPECTASLSAAPRTSTTESWPSATELTPTPARLTG